MIWGIAADDLHSGDHPDRIDEPAFDRQRAWVLVRAGECTRPAILEALRRGSFYSTTGPFIKDISIVDGEIRVETSPVKSILFASLPWTGTRKIAEPGAMLTHTVVQLDSVATAEKAEQLVSGMLRLGTISRKRKTGAYFRVEIWDGGEGYAWSNPIFLSGAAMH